MCNDFEAWARIGTGHVDDEWVLNCIAYGFPLQYRGPALSARPVVNHPSALNYPDHVTRYIATELKLGALVGPFTRAPFDPWCNTAPLMSRPKQTMHDRRIIVDLSYPVDSGPNSFIIKNHVFGVTVPHVLPGISDAIAAIVCHGFQVTLAAIDIARAYRNFPLEPLDWPLNCIAFNDEHFIDTCMPFGSRLSSLYMQRIASMLQRALAHRGVVSIIYLDDALLISPRCVDPEDQFRVAIAMFREVGLPIAWSKLIAPTTVVKFLGIIIDVDARELCMPHEKIQNFIELARRISLKRAVTRRELQSVIGHINHLGKVVKSATVHE